MPDFRALAARALSFGAAASAYERFRPGYPESLVDEVLAYAGRPVRTALEIGAGTGKATRVFARPVGLTATDPDPAMLAELRKHVPDSVRMVCAALEDLEATTTYDLVFVAAALHWTDPGTRWARVAALLGPGATFASFGGPLDLEDDVVAAAVHEARAPFLADDDIPAPDGTPPGSPMLWPGTELSRSELFTDVRQSVIERRVVMSARDYVGLLSTISEYLELSEPMRGTVLRRILDVLPEQVRLVGDITMHLARRAG